MKEKARKFVLIKAEIAVNKEIIKNTFQDRKIKYDARVRERERERVRIIMIAILSLALLYIF